MTQIYNPPGIVLFSEEERNAECGLTCYPPLVTRILAVTDTVGTTTDIHSYFLIGATANEDSCHRYFGTHRG